MSDKPFKVKVNTQLFHILADCSTVVEARQ